MGLRWGLVVLVTVLVSSEALTIRRDESEMQLEDEVEFPFAAVDDSVAGVPGTGVMDRSHQIGAAHSTRYEQAQVGCDMTGQSGNGTPGEEPEIIATPEEDEEIRMDETNTHSVDEYLQPLGKLTRTVRPFACYTAKFYPNIAPRIRTPFNMYLALFEGNDKLGTAHSSEFQVSDCACTCSGYNSLCGISGSKTYYSGVDSEESCAQMICHENKFSACYFRQKVVSRGNWHGEAVSFNSTVLQPLDDSPYIPNQDPLQLLPSFSASASPSPSTAPSASPIPSPPSRRTLTILRALSIIASVKERLCLTVTPSLVEEVHKDLLSVNISLPAIPCPPPVDFTKVGKDLSQIIKENATIGNALAGYSGGSVLANDPTQSTSGAMNSVGSFIEVDLKLDTIESTAWKLVVRVFNDLSHIDVRCGALVQPVETLLNFAMNITPSCNQTHSELKAAALLQSATLLQESAPISSSRLFYTIVLEKVNELFVHKHPPTTTNQPTNDKPSPPTIPGKAPGPPEATPNPAEPMAGGSSRDLADCEDGTDMLANDLQIQDLSGSIPGARQAAVFSQHGSRVLPEFGKTKLTWSKLESNAITMPQPQPFDDAEEVFQESKVIV